MGSKNPSSTGESTWIECEHATDAMKIRFGSNGAAGSRTHSNFLAVGYSNSQRGGGEKAQLTTPMPVSRWSQWQTKRDPAGRPSRGRRTSVYGYLPQTDHRVGSDRPATHATPLTGNAASSSPTTTSCRKSLLNAAWTTCRAAGSGASTSPTDPATRCERRLCLGREQRPVVQGRLRLEPRH